MYDMGRSVTKDIGPQIPWGNHGRLNVVGGFKVSQMGCKGEGKGDGTKEATGIQ